MCIFILAFYKFLVTFKSNATTDYDLIVSRNCFALQVNHIRLESQNHATRTSIVKLLLLDISAKIYDFILPHRIRPAVDPFLRKNQNGFRTELLQQVKS